MINLWATYCTPCVQELPYFSQLAKEYPEISILAVHSGLVTEDDIPGYIAQRDWDGITFAVDTEDGAVYSCVGGDALLPRTIILNARGEVTFNEAGSMSHEKLEALVQAAE